MATRLAYLVVFIAFLSGCDAGVAGKATFEGPTDTTGATEPALDATPADAAPNRPGDARPGDAQPLGALDARPTDALPAEPTDAAPLDAAPSDPPDGGSACGPCAGTCRAGVCGQLIHNPVLTGDHPDPDVLRLEDGTYLLSHTVHDGGDLPLYRSRDLATWDRLPTGAFGRPRVPGDGYVLNNATFCALWAPDLVAIPGGYLLAFSAMRFPTPQAPCPAYREDGGVYQAWSPTPEGPFARPDHPWEPLPAGANEAACPLRDQLPRSVAYVADDCQGTWCHHIIRLDSDTWRDPATGRWWMSYAWYTNDPPRVDWERAHHGEHVSLVELDPNDPFAVRCDANTPQVYVADPHDAALQANLAASCVGCGEHLAFNRGRQGEAMQRSGVSWGVAEGPALFRRGDWVYALMSGSAWDSDAYHVFWVAARTVEGLAWDAPGRLTGRLLIPSDGQAFGHGAPVLGPDGVSWFYVHHHLDAGACRTRGDCHRDLWVTPITFIDRGDGLGPVHIAPRWPAREAEVFIPGAP